VAVDDAWNPSKLCMSCIILGWILDDERSNEELERHGGFVTLLGFEWGVEESGEDTAEGQVDDEVALLDFEMRLVEPPPTLSSSARDKIHSERGWWTFS